MNQLRTSASSHVRPPETHTLTMDGVFFLSLIHISRTTTSKVWGGLPTNLLCVSPNPKAYYHKNQCRHTRGNTTHKHTLPDWSKYLSPVWPKNVPNLLYNIISTRCMLRVPKLAEQKKYHNPPPLPLRCGPGYIYHCRNLNDSQNYNMNDRQTHTHTHTVYSLG